MNGQPMTMEQHQALTAAQESMDGSPAEVKRHEHDYVDNASSSTPWLSIRFQCGPVASVGRNGVQIENVIDVLVERLEGFQRGPFRCRENALAITKLEEARQWLMERTRKRQAQGVEGTNAQHRE
jgi:hypothetical protein